MHQKLCVQKEDNELVWVKMCKETDDLLIATALGMVTRYPVHLFSEYKSTGQGAGVKSVKLAKNDSVIGMAVIDEQARDFRRFSSHTAPWNSHHVSQSNLTFKAALKTIRSIPK